MDAKCEACKYNVTVEEICRVRKEDMALDPSLGPLDGCPTGTPTEEPPTCYSKDLKKEVMHGEMGARNCCWYGDWKSKSKCEKKPSHPHNCYSKIWKKEIMHGEVGARKCCWYGDWKKKSKCETKPSHRDNCYSNILKKEVMHGEMGARKCCWYGDWKRKSKCNGGHKDD